MRNKLLLFVMIICANVSMFAQSNLQFMNIPLNEDFETFKEKLEQKDIHKDRLGKYNFSGHFFDTIASIRIGYNEETENVYSALVRYNQSMTNLPEAKMKVLYRNIYQGLKKKYPKAQVKEVSGKLLLVLKEGYILLKAFEAPKAFGGITIELKYEDKTNSPKFEIPKLKNIEDDL